MPDDPAPAPPASRPAAPEPPRQAEPASLPASLTVAPAGKDKKRKKKTSREPPRGRGRR